MSEEREEQTAPTTKQIHELADTIEPSNEVIDEAKAYAEAFEADYMLTLLWNELATIKAQLEGKPESYYHWDNPKTRFSWRGQNITVSRSEDRLLRDVAEHPFKPLTERYELFSNDYKGNTVKNKIIDQGLVIERHVRVEPVKRTLLQFTDKGREYVQEQDDVELNREGRGGIVHQFWQDWIKQVFKDAGWNAEIEKHDADVAVTTEGLELAIEVATGNNPREIWHVEKHLERFDRVWIACRTPDVRSGLRERLELNGPTDEQVALKLFSDFIDPDIGSL